MKILEIIPQLSQGGAERFVVDLCNELSMRHNVTLVVLHNIDKTGFFLKEMVSQAAPKTEFPPASCVVKPFSSSRVFCA